MRRPWVYRLLRMKTEEEVGYLGHAANEKINKRMDVSLAGPGESLESGQGPHRSACRAYPLKSVSALCKGRGGVNGQGGTGSFGENRIRQILTHSDTGLMHEKKQAETKRKGLQMPKKEAKHSSQRPGVDEERLT